MTITQPLKWHGGKNYLAPWIISHFPKRCGSPSNPSNAPGDFGYLHYVEPYAGGLSVLLQNDPHGISEVVNDLNGALINFWRVLKNPIDFVMLQSILQLTPFSEETYNENILQDEDASDVSRAASFFVQCRQSMAGRMDCFTPLTRNRTRGGMNAEVNAWLNAIDGLPEVHARLQRVVIFNKPAVEVIKQQDGERTLYYVDPPYVHETRETTGEYKHEMSEDDHAELLLALSKIKGRFVLSGYPSALYDAEAKRYGWRRVSKQIDNKSSSKDVKDLKTECLWMNY